jgi:hypothetical protein
MRKSTDSYNLQIINPRLSKEWHPTKNGILTPKDVTPGSGRKVWWICGNNHEWVAKVSYRTDGTGCPYCSGKAVCSDNCLETKNPKLSREWHRTKNKNLTPKDVTPCGRRKVWWQCKKGHEWMASVSSRSWGTACPSCSKRKAKEKKSPQNINKILSEQWHPLKNGNLMMKDVSPNSHKKVWWQCKKGHEWKVAIAYRSKGSGCPYCAGKLASKERNLKILNPKLAEQWHPVKNGKLAPEDILPGAHRKVWWQCKKGHEWKAFVFARSKGTGCPYCSRKKI